MKIYQVVQKLLVGDRQTQTQTQTQTHTHTGDLISLLSFLGSRLKRKCVAAEPHIYIPVIFSSFTTFFSGPFNFPKFIM
jgi:hypothetical protein